MGEKKRERKEGEIIKDIAIGIKLLSVYISQRATPVDGNMIKMHGASNGDEGAHLLVHGCGSRGVRDGSSRRPLSPGIGLEGSRTRPPGKADDGRGPPLGLLAEELRWPEVAGEWLPRESDERGEGLMAVAQVVDVLERVVAVVDSTHVVLVLLLFGCKAPVDEDDEGRRGGGGGACCCCCCWAARWWCGWKRWPGGRAASCCKGVSADTCPGAEGGTSVERRTVMKEERLMQYTDNRSTTLLHSLRNHHLHFARAVTVRQKSLKYSATDLRIEKQRFNTRNNYDD